MSSHRAERRRACKGKVRHASQSEAVAQLIGMRRRGLTTTHHTYECHFCHGWHIGRPPRRVRQAMGAGSHQ